MTVAELIKELQDLPQDLRVYVDPGPFLVALTKDTVTVYSVPKGEEDRGCIDDFVCPADVDPAPGREYYQIVALGAE